MNELISEMEMLRNIAAVIEDGSADERRAMKQAVERLFLEKEQQLTDFENAMEPRSAV